MTAEIIRADARYAVFNAPHNEVAKSVYTMTLTYHGEDRYNFNPGMGGH